MPISVTIEVRPEEEEYCLEDISTTPEQFVVDVQANGGVWLPTIEGMTRFIPLSSITSLFFDDGTYEPDEVDLHQHKDLTIN